MEFRLAAANPNTEAIQGLLGCMFAILAGRYAYRGGPVRYGTIPMPKEGRVVIGVCAVIIFVYSLRRLLAVVLT